MGNYTRGAYHSSRPSWRNGFNEEGNYVGIEFEVDSHNYQTVLSLLPDFPADIRPLTECDGSLGSNGVEIVFPPISLSRLKRADCTFQRSIAAIKDAVIHSERTGMHMNVNTRGWSNDATAVFTAIVQHMDEEHLRNLGGRRPTDYCAQCKGRAFTRYRRGFVSHTVADNKDHRIELRFPMSTCNKETIDGLVDFIERLTAFATRNTEQARALVDNIPLTEQSSVQVWYQEPVVARYERLVAAFYTFLSKTKKGKKVLDILHTAKPEAPEADWDDEYDEDYDGDQEDW